ncbi:MAG: biopolymer transporter ExbD [Kiritimatiellia bacterium]
MNFRKHQPVLPQFQMTAMMDVIFLLLCFFITSTVFSQWEYEVDVLLPSARSAQMPTRLPGEIILNVSRHGIVSVNQRSFSGEALERLLHQVAGYLPGQPIIIRADKGTPYGEFMKVVDACRMAGIANLSLATIDATSPELLPEATPSTPLAP